MPQIPRRRVGELAEQLDELWYVVLELFEGYARHCNGAAEAAFALLYHAEEGLAGGDV